MFRVRLARQKSHRPEMVDAGTGELGIRLNSGLIRPDGEKITRPLASSSSIRWRRPEFPRQPLGLNRSAG